MRLLYSLTAHFVIQCELLQPRRFSMNCWSRNARRDYFFGPHKTRRVWETRRSWPRSWITSCGFASEPRILKRTSIC